MCIFIPNLIIIIKYRLFLQTEKTEKKAYQSFSYIFASLLLVSLDVHHKEIASWIWSIIYVTRAYAHMFVTARIV